MSNINDENSREEIEWSVRRYRDDLAQEDHLHIVFPRAGGDKGSILVPMAAISAPGKVTSDLLKKGADLSANRRERSGFVQSLIDKIPTTSGKLATSTGWCDRSFLSRDEFFKWEDEDALLHPDASAANSWVAQKSGTFESWRSSVAEPSAGSSYASFAIMHALASPLYRFAGLSEGAIFNFSAPSSVGKTTALRAGASVTGDPTVLPDWNATTRGLQERAAAHSSMQLILDDTETLRLGREDRFTALHTITHNLTVGKSTDYAGSVHGHLRPLQWTCWAISTSPHPIDAMYAAAKRERSGGDQVRLIDIPVPKADCGGIWDRSDDGCDSAAVQSETLRTGSVENHGHAFAEWVAHLVIYQDEIAPLVRHHMNRFVEKVAPGASDMERRIARKFGLVYAAGKIATERGLLPWDEKHAASVTKCLFLRAIEVLDGGKRKTRSELQDLVVYAANRYPRFDEGRRPSFRSDVNLQGYVSGAGNNERLHVRSSALRMLFGTGAGNLVRRLKEIHALEDGEGGKVGKQVRVNIAGAVQKTRMLVIKTAVLRANLASSRSTSKS